MKLPCKITISRIHNNRDDSRPISLTVVDDSSGCEFVEIRMELADFAEALTGLGYVKCEAEVRMDAPIGKIREHKTELVPRVPFTIRGKRDTKAVRAALEPFEVDGWKGYVDDLFNHHRSQGEYSRVSFTRYVEPESGHA